MEIIIALALSLFLIIIVLVMFGIYQIKLTGLEIRDFWSFVKAHEKLNKLTNFAKKYQNLSKADQVLFLSEAQTVFDAFDKVPTKLWEDEYNKYMQLVERYQKERNKTWKNTNMRERKITLRSNRGRIILPIVYIVYAIKLVVKIWKKG